MQECRNCGSGQTSGLSGLFFFLVIFSWWTRRFKKKIGKQNKNTTTSLSGLANEFMICPILIYNTHLSQTWLYKANQRRFWLGQLLELFWVAAGTKPHQHCPCIMLALGKEQDVHSRVWKHAQLMPKDIVCMCDQEKERNEGGKEKRGFHLNKLHVL